MTRWRYGICSGPGCGWRSWVPAGSAPNWPRRPPRGGARARWERRGPGPPAPAAARGGQVTVVEAGPAPLASAVGAPVGSQTAGWYAAAGVDLRVGVSVAAVQPGGLALAGGEWIAAGEIVPAGGGGPAASR